MFTFLTDILGPFGIIVGISLVLLIIKMSFGLLFYIADSILFGKTATGNRFEEKIATRLKRKAKGKLYRNVLFNKVDPKEFYNANDYEKLALAQTETEADMILVNRKGIFCFECKHRNGDLKGTS